MKLEQLPSGSYRATKMYKGTKYRVTFDHKPTEKELTIAFAEKMQDVVVGQKSTFEKCALEYIQSRDKVVSQSTIRTYNIKLNQLSEDFKKTNITDIDNIIVQSEINQFAEDHAPKTVRTLHGFIASVLGVYRPNLRLKTKLPQAIQKEEYAPNKDDVMALIDMANGTHFHVAFQLAAFFGCRRGEICALTLDDLSGNDLWIHRNMVYSDNEWVIKENPKTDASNRTITLPESLADEIREQGFIFDGHPNALNKAVHRYQKKLGIKEFEFHAFRKFFCSYSHDIGISEANILSIGGWSTPSVMRSVYRKSMEDSKKESMKKIFEELSKG